MYFTPRMVTTDMLALREAAMAGAGVVQLPLLMVRDQLASGELEVVLDEWRAAAGSDPCGICLTARAAALRQGRWWTTSAKSISGWRRDC